MAEARTIGFTMVGFTMVGFTMVGFISVFVPQSFWNTVFLVGDSAAEAPSFWVMVENALVAPVIAFFTLIGSMGNVPPAAMLWAKIASFASVMTFIGAGLVAATVVHIHAKYYGWRYAAYVSVVLYVCMLAAGLTVHGLFALAGILPTVRPTLEEMVAFEIDYTFWFNIAFVLIGGGLLFLRLKGSSEMSVGQAAVRQLWQHAASLAAHRTTAA